MDALERLQALLLLELKEAHNDGALGRGVPTDKRAAAAAWRVVNLAYEEKRNER